MIRTATAECPVSEKLLHLVETDIFDDVRKAFTKLTDAPMIGPVRFTGFDDSKLPEGVANDGIRCATYAADFEVSE